MGREAASGWVHNRCLGISDGLAFTVLNICVVVCWIMQVWCVYGWRMHAILNARHWQQKDRDWRQRARATTTLCWSKSTSLSAFTCNRIRTKYYSPQFLLLHHFLGADSGDQLLIKNLWISRKGKWVSSMVLEESLLSIKDNVLMMSTVLFVSLVSPTDPPRSTTLTPAGFFCHSKMPKQYQSQTVSSNNDDNSQSTSQVTSVYNNNNNNNNVPQTQSNKDSEAIARFNKRFKGNARTAESILGAYHGLYSCFCQLTITCTRSWAKEALELATLRSLPPANDQH